MIDDLAGQLAIWWRKWDAQAAARGRPVKPVVEERAPWLVKRCRANFPNENPATWPRNAEEYYRRLRDDVAEQLREFVASNTSTGIRIDVVDLHGGPGVVVNPHSPYVAAAQQAIAAAFGKPAVLIREGGSMPIVANMVEKLGADVLLLGWGLDDDGAHSPNEKFCIQDYFHGIRASSHLWHELSQVQA